MGIIDDETVKSIMEADRISYDDLYTLMNAIYCGCELSFLSNMLSSDRNSRRAAGLYIMEEMRYEHPTIVQRADEIAEAALVLKDRRDRTSRKAFIEAHIGLNVLSEPALLAVINSLDSSDLYVRCLAIKYMVTVHSDFVRRIHDSVLFDAKRQALFESDNVFSSSQRQIRACKIAAMIKSGIPLGIIKEKNLKEDSATFEILQEMIFSET